MEILRTASRPLMMVNNERMQIVSCPRLSGKVTALAVERGKCEQKGKSGFYRAVLNICLSFLNEVKNLGKEYGC